MGTPVPTRVAVVYHSAFQGSTARLAERIAKGAASVEGVSVDTVAVEQIDEAWAKLHAADAMIFGSPTYVGSMAARFKQFVEQCAGEIWLERLWLNKLASGFTVSAGRSGDKLNCLQDMVIFAAQMGMIWVPMRIVGGNYSSYGSEADLNRMAGYLGVMAQANIDEGPEQTPPESDLATAELHGHHVATIARQISAGRELVGTSYATNIRDPARKGRPLDLREISGRS